MFGLEWKKAHDFNIEITCKINSGACSAEKLILQQEELLTKLRIGRGKEKTEIRKGKQMYGQNICFPKLLLSFLL
jgi:hypothetical protein